MVSNIDFWLYQEYVVYNITILRKILFNTQYLRIQENI